jgi:hypothetical protein
MVNRAAAVIAVVVVLTAAVACTPSAPTTTPTPEPTATPVEVLATKPEHVAGTWFDGASWFRFGADGTVHGGESLEQLDNPDFRFEGRFWFEDGLYHEENSICAGIYIYEASLLIQEGQAVRIRMKEVDVPDHTCPDRRLRRLWRLERVD